MQKSAVAALLLFCAALVQAAPGKDPEIRFHSISWKPDSPFPAVTTYGLVNRVRYRYDPSSPGSVEREPTAEADPQKGALVRPAAIPGARWIREPLACATPQMREIGWGDFDGDGSDELLLDFPLIVCKREPDGAWKRVARIPAKASARLVHIADINRDGLADIFIAGEKPTLFQNVTRLPWVRHVIESEFQTQTAVAGNFAGHGRQDVITGDIENDRKIFLFAAPDWDRVQLIAGIRVIQSLAMDVDGDGQVDYIGAQYHPGLIFWLEHPKDALHEEWKFHTIDDSRRGGADGVHGLALSDIDGDGKLELIAVSDWPEGGFPNSILWYHLPQQPRSAERWPRFTLADRDAPGFGHYLGIGDVNLDGLTDVATGAKSGPDGNWFAWWEHPGDLAHPWKKHVIATNQPGATNIVVADLNQDGSPDFLASRGHGKGVVWFEGPSWSPHQINTSLVGPHALAVADLDGDGDPDFAVCAKDSGILAWYENDGRGNFTEHRISEDQSAYEIKLVDMNGDGTPDILVAGEVSGNVVWFENRLHDRNWNVPNQHLTKMRHRTSR